MSVHDFAFGLIHPYNPDLLIKPSSLPDKY